MLNAIGIYEEDETLDGSVLKKVKFSQQEKNTLFASNQLETVETLLFKSPLYSTMEPYKIYFSERNKECIYLYISNATRKLCAISSRKPLDRSEQAALFQNIEHILIRPDTIKRTL